MNYRNLLRLKRQSCHRPTAKMDKGIALHLNCPVIEPFSERQNGDGLE